MGTGNLLPRTLIFLVVALVAGAVGFLGLVPGAAPVAQIIFWTCLILLVVSVAMNFARR